MTPLKLHAILATLGSDGDVFPYVALGARLRARGHRVTLAANEQYRALAERHGLGFRALVSDAEMDEFLGHPDVWHPVKSGPHGARWGVRFIRRNYELLAELARDGETVLAANPGVLAARLVQEKLARPLATVALQPWFFPSVHVPPVMPRFTLPRWAPRPVGALYWRAIHLVGDLLVGRALNRARADLGLPPVRRALQWWMSPQLVLGLFPAWYAPPPLDWPPQLRLTGFPRFDGGADAGVPADVRDFCRAGEPPVVFTFGTAMLYAGELFRAAVEACERLGARGLLLTKHPGQLPAALPPTVRHCAFAPFGELFPLCAAVVHHGGIGTTARALAAGVPQLIVPFAWDQRDNAARVRRLGVGDGLRPGRRGGRHLADGLTRVMTPETRERCRTVATRFADDGDALDNAAKWIEELARGPASGS